jgi:hypothetical protein
MTEAIPTLQRKTSKLESGTSCTAHEADNTREVRQSEASKRQGSFPSNEKKISYPERFRG